MIIISMLATIMLLSGINKKNNKDITNSVTTNKIEKLSTLDKEKIKEFNKESAKEVKDQIKEKTNITKDEDLKKLKKEMNEFINWYTSWYNKAKIYLKDNKNQWDTTKEPIILENTNISNIVYNNIVKELYYNKWDIKKYQILPKLGSNWEWIIKNDYFWKMFTNYYNIKS